MFIRQVAILIVSAFLLGPEAPAVSLDSTYVNQLRQGIAFTVTEQFDSARSVFAALIQADSADHAARLYLAGVDHAEMLDREDYSRKEQFNLAAEAAIETAEGALTIKGGTVDRDHDSAWAYLTIGNAHAYIASLEAKAGSWWTAMRRGVKAKGAYLKALELNPRLYDAYLGLGTYHFWKSAKTEFINWLPLVPDKKSEGVDELLIAVDSSLLSNDLALNSLVWIYIQQKQTDLALACAKRLHDKYPESRLFTWAMAFSSYADGHFHDALDYFGKIIASLESDPTQNYFNLIECRHHRGEIFEMVNDSSAAALEYRALVEYPVPANVRDRQEGKIDHARRFINKAANTND